MDEVRQTYQSMEVHCNEISFASRHSTVVTPGILPHSSITTSATTDRLDGNTPRIHLQTCGGASAPHTASRRGESEPGTTRHTCPERGTRRIGLPRPKRAPRR